VVPRIDVGRADAVRAAQAALDARGVTLQPGTRTLAASVGSPGDEDQFVWQTAGRDAYESLLGVWLDPPRYRVRFARFEGDVAERAEEWFVVVGPDGTVRGVRHRVPEARQGRTLTEDEARTLARTALERELEVSASTVREVSAVPSKLPARTDWSFAFTDTTGAALPQGERRLRIDIAGDEVVGAARYIHVPEEWERKQRATDAMLGVLSALRAIASAVLLVAGAIAAIVAWSRGHFATRHFLIAGLVTFVTGGAALLNNWPAIAAQFSTAQPFRLQTMLMLAGGVVAQGAIAAAVALVAGLVAPWRRPHADLRTRLLVLAAVFVGTATTGASLLTAALSPSVTPAWPSLAGAGTVVPALAPVLGGLTTYLLVTAGALLLFGAAERFTASWTRRRGLSLALLLVAGAIVGGSTTAGTVFAWATSAVLAGLTLALAYALVVRHDLAVVPLVTATVSLLGLLPTLDRPYAGALAGGVAAAVTIAVVGWYWFRAILANHRAERVVVGVDE